jgi:hypothetical protein
LGAEQSVQAEENRFEIGHFLPSPCCGPERIGKDIRVFALLRQKLFLDRFAGAPAFAGRFAVSADAATR